MRLSTQLLGAVIGVSMLAMLVYGSLAYWLTLNAEQQKHHELLAHFADEIAPALTTAEVTEARHLNLLHRRLLPADVVLMLWTPEGWIGAGPQDARLQAYRNAARHLLNREPTQGEVHINERDHAWYRRVLDDKGWQMFLFKPFTNTDRMAASTLRSRLLVTGIIILWVAVWVALILSKIISRRLEEKNRALRHQALHDTLTGLPNRNLLLDRMQQARLNAQRQNQPFALFLMDLNHFKEVNDTLGHTFGDALLKEVGLRIQHTLRENDSIARLGGDEFAVLLPETDRHGAMVCASRIHQALQQPFAIEGVRIEVGASIGIALYPEHGEEPDTLLQHADVAMYQAKRSGGYAFYDPGQDSHSVRRLRLMSELRSAIETGQLSLHYQPMVDLRSGKPVAVEILARWPHPELGLIPPDEFIPMAEQTGTIHALTLWALTTALQEQSHWPKTPQPLILSLNLSPHCLQDSALADAIGEVLQRHAFPHHRLQLEITENALMHDLQRARQLLARLHELGLRLAIDDFGTGFSSLAYLRELPFDELKIDKSFVLDMQSENNLAIVRTIIDLGHNLRYRVVAEGVEDATTLQRLHALGCDVVQGFLFSQPLQNEPLRNWLQTNSQCVNPVSDAASSPQ